VEMLLTGKYEYQMDSKGRIIIPVEFRNAFLVDGIAEVNLLSVNDRIQLLPQQALKELISELKSHSSLDEDTMDLKSVLYSNLKKIEMKPDGRLTIPPLFRNDAGLEKSVYVIGAEDRVEIWSTEKWNERFKKPGKKLGDLFRTVHDKRYRKDVNLYQKDG
jgi:MraZ protein